MKARISFSAVGTVEGARRALHVVRVEEEVRDDDGVAVGVAREDAARPGQHVVGRVVVEVREEEVDATGGDELVVAPVVVVAAAAVFPAAVAGGEHPRARVAFEERARWLPARLARWLYPAVSAGPLARQRRRARRAETAPGGGA